MSVKYMPCFGCGVPMDEPCKDDCRVQLIYQIDKEVYDLLPTAAIEADEREETV